MNKQISEEATQHILSGNKIAAIAAIRKELNCSLSEAKSIVDEFNSDLGSIQSGETSQEKDKIIVCYHISFLERIMMLFRNSPVRLIIKCLKKAQISSLSLNAQLLETHYMAGGNLTDLVDGMVLAGNSGIQIDLDNAAARQLAGKQKSISLVDQVISMASKGVTNADDEPINF